MIYYKLKDGKISQVLETEDEELAQRSGYCCDREIVQVYNGGYMFADEATPADFLPSLNDVKLNKINQLKAERDRREVEPLQTSKGVFDYDDKSRDRLTIARQALMDNDSIPFLSWTTADNQRVTLTVNDFAEINSMAAYRSNVLHIKYNELKIEVNDCKTAEEVEAITWGD